MCLIEEPTTLNTQLALLGTGSACGVDDTKERRKKKTTPDGNTASPETSPCLNIMSIIAAGYCNHLRLLRDQGSYKDYREQTIWPWFEVSVLMTQKRWIADP
jgi:hypothetical protein